jgi:non-lysosomal glucosylceramidase
MTNEANQDHRNGLWHAPQLTGSATVAAFPLGGIGTGNVSIGARGEFRDWEISNHADKGTWLPFTFFAIHAAPEGSEPVTRVLESELQVPHEGDSGYHIGKVAGLPRLKNSRMRGEYPLLAIEFDDDVLPVDVTLTAFTPLVPLNADESGIPAAVIRYTVTNPGSVPADVTIAGSMANPIGITSHDTFYFPRYEGMPSVGFRESDEGAAGILRGLEFGTDLPDDSVRFGSAVLATRDESVTATPQWPVARWQDGVQLFWDDFSADGRLEPAKAFSTEPDPDSARLPRLRVGSLGIVHTLQAGESRDFEFILSWHTPNRARAWNGMCGLPNTHADEIVLNHYATRFGSAWDAASHLADNLHDLEAVTRRFHDSLFSSSLPAEVVDAVSATLVVIRSTTCFRIDNGTAEGLFAAWEGSFDHAGSCEGTCTHVWNYAQSVANVFPELERSARRTEFLNETLPDGRMRFRANSLFDAEPLEFHPAVDGQLGTVVRLYREWKFSGDDEFLAELWPKARLALDYAFTTWDSNGDFVLDSQQHNTYDIEFYGENSLANSMFFAALAAGAAMAEHLGDSETAERYREAARIGSARMDELLFNGEYYDQRIEDVDSVRYQYGKGCLSDQLLGQTLAHLVGLGHILPRDHVRSAVSAVFRHNFRTDFHDYDSVQRTYALNDESGLVLCTWPNGGRPVIPFVYSDEVWSGIEYQVATHLVFEGFVDEGLAIVRAVRDRHDGVRRNPWNEVECGNHYARSMASWGVLLALTGTEWDAPRRTMHLAPKAEAFSEEQAARYFVSTASGWGEATFDSSGASLEALGGEIAIDELTADHPALGLVTALGPVTLRAGQSTRLTSANSKNGL